MYVHASCTTQTLLEAYTDKSFCITRYGSHLDLPVLFETVLDVNHSTKYKAI